MKEHVLIQGGSLLLPDAVYPGDLLIKDGKIAALGDVPQIDPEQAGIVDAAGCMVMPGGIDPHVHFALPVGGHVSADDFDSGTAAALAGGTTTIIDFVTPEHDQKIPDAFQQRLEQARTARTDYALHMSVTQWRNETPAEMEQCLHEYGSTSVKVYMAYRETIGLNSDELRRVLKVAAGLGLTLLVHCEDNDLIEAQHRQLSDNGQLAVRYHPDSRPPQAELAAVRQLIQIMDGLDVAVYVVHVSTAAAAREIGAARRAGVRIFAETCPHYLLLNRSRYETDVRDAVRYVMSPPLRDAQNVDELWSCLSEGMIDTVATDHCPFQEADRLMASDDFRRIPNGIGGVEERVALLFHQFTQRPGFTLPQFARLIAGRASDIFQLAGKGELRVGNDADLVLYDPQRPHQFTAASQSSRADTSTWEGANVGGSVRAVWQRGRLAWQDGVMYARPGDGKYLNRNRGKNNVAADRAH